MFESRKLEQLIRERVPLGPLTAKGFHSLKCPICHDYKDRLGIKFDGQSVGANCFNCGLHTKYDEFSGMMPKKLRKLLNAFGIEDSDIDAVVNVAFFNKPVEKQTISLADLKKVNTYSPPIKFPANTYRLGETYEHEDKQIAIIDYLLKRGISPESYPFFFSNSGKYVDRVIIPFYRNGQLVYWQARHIDSTRKDRYENPVVSREAIIFNIDQLFSRSPTPLLITEGVFDALPFNGAAILGSKFTPAKLELLKRSTRRLIFVIDKDNNGKQLAKDVLEHGWEITFAPGEGDINSALQLYGQSYTARELYRSIPHSLDEAYAHINAYCIRKK